MPILLVELVLVPVLVFEPVLVHVLLLILLLVCVILLLRSSTPEQQSSQASTVDLRYWLEDRKAVLGHRSLVVKSGMVEQEDELEPPRKKVKMDRREKKEKLLNVMSQFFTELAKD